jgi:hypothetical protein
LIIGIKTGIDSLLGDTVNGGFREDTVRIGTARPLFTSSEIGHPENVRNNIGIAYAATFSPADSLRTVLIRYSVDSGYNDTLHLRLGESRQYNLVGNSNTMMVVDFSALESSLLVRSYLSVRSAGESNDFRDPATGESITELVKQLPRFLKPTDKALTLRATDGFQRLINRARSNANVLQDFQLLPVAYPAVDPKTGTGEDKVPMLIHYPVLSVVAPALQAGKLKVTVELYLYPLKAR